jgi:hypothetical protein
MEDHKEIRNKIREALFSIENDKNLGEYDLLFKTKTSWEESKTSLRSDLINLLKHIEEDEYKEGVEKIDDVIYSLKKWKSKIQKKLNNNKD